MTDEQINLLPPIHCQFFFKLDIKAMLNMLFNLLAADADHQLKLQQCIRAVCL
jgi:hypothetical protein